jgi:beta-galactosidase
MSIMRTIGGVSTSNNVSLRSNAVVINGVPTWLISGTVHYFRIPRQMWKPCLQLCLDGGLNCIDTYVAWNIHEAREGEFDFIGDRDLEHFIQLADELGLHVIVRVGPYICAEHRLGGYPTWLLQKENIVLREPNQAHNDYVRSWFGNLLPRIAPLQASHNGPVILIQCENEYAFRDRPGGEVYIRFVRDLIRGGGIDVPIITCNSLAIPMDDLVDCHNGRSDFTLWLNRYGSAQADSPRIVSEYYPGWFSIWDEPYVEHRTPGEVFRDVIDITANGGMLNHYMYAGGTNFAFQAGRSGLGRNRFITTSCDYQSPIGEGLLVGEKYAVTRLAHNIVRLFMNALVEAELYPVSTPQAGWCVIERDVSQGKLIFVIRRDGSGDQTNILHTSLGDELHLDASDCDAFVLPYRYQLTDNIHINDSCFQPFGVVGQHLLMCGSRGANGVVTINGDSKHLTVPQENGIVLEEVIGGITVLLMTVRSAAHTKLGSETADIGLRAGLNASGNYASPGFDMITRVDTNGIKRFSAKQIESFEPPRIVNVRRLQTDSGLFYEDAFQPIAKPISIDTLSPGSGYLWYSFKFETDQEQHVNLFFTGAADRIHLYIDGQRQGIFGSGSGATTKPIPIVTKKGHNHWLMLVDALGYRNSTIPLEDHKGIWRDPEHATEVAVESDDLAPTTHPGQNHEPAWSSTRRREAAITEYWVRTFNFRPNVPKASRLWLKLRPFKCFAWIFLNDRLVASHDGSLHSNHRDLSVDACDLQELNELKIVVEGSKSVAQDLTAKIFMLSDIEGHGFQWSTAEWTQPVDATPEEPDSDAIRPVWWEARFHISEMSEMPLFMQCEGLSKGVAFLNGHNIGRYWNGSSQKHYFLPTPLLQPDNRIIFYDEDGCSPEHIQMEYLDRPISEIRLDSHAGPSQVYHWENNV